MPPDFGGEENFGLVSCLGIIASSNRPPKRRFVCFRKIRYNPQPKILTMTSPYDRLGISSSATPAEIKAATHAKAEEFPAHRHPERIMGT